MSIGRLKGKRSPPCHPLDLTEMCVTLDVNGTMLFRYLVLLLSKHSVLHHLSASAASSSYGTTHVSVYNVNIGTG